VSYLPELRGELVRAAGRRAAPAPIPNRAGRRIVRTVSLLVSVAVVLAVAAIVLVVRHQSAPPNESGHPSAAGLSQLRSMLSALRGPETSTDRAFRAMVLPLPGRTAGSDIEPLWSDVRLATVTPWGAKVFLVPLRPRNAAVAKRNPVDITTWVQGIGWDDYSFANDVESGNDWGPSKTVHLADGRVETRFVEVVPDGVEKVVFHLVRRLARPEAQQAFVGRLTATVHGNVAAFSTTSRDTSFVFAAWYAADGRLIKRVGDWSAAIEFTPGREQLIDVLAVLRRPQTSADLHSGDIPAILRRGSTPFSRSVDTRLVRRAGVTAWGAPLLLIPFLPATAAQRRRSSFARTAESKLEGIWINSGGGSCCYTAANVEAGNAMNEGGVGSLITGKHQTRLIMLVPDGVARVEFRWHSPRLDVTARVHDNVASVAANRPCCHGIERTIWYSADGRVIRQRSP
jgi:hypothetical protein